MTTLRHPALVSLRALPYRQLVPSYINWFGRTGSHRSAARAETRRRLAVQQPMTGLLRLVCNLALTLWTVAVLAFCFVVAAAFVL